MARVKLGSQIDCSALADKMLRVVLRAQLEGMCALRNKALDWDELKGVHDMRVLSRRLRSAISDFKPYLEKSNLPRLKLRAIARSLGAVRDEDVTLLALAELKTIAVEQVADGIELFEQERCRKRDEARAKLKNVISRTAIKDFRKEFLSSIGAKATAAASNSPGDHSLSFGHLGVQVINRRLKELNASSRYIYFPFEVKEIHNLRILAKRLRYAIELFAVCWGKEAEEMAKEISLLQDSLGALHDCDVWIERLGTRLVQAALENKSEDDHLRLKESAVWMLEYFAGKRAEHYRDALARWHQWEADGFLKNLKSTVDRVLPV